jgi:hypothetical protein
VQQVARVRAHEQHGADETDGEAEHDAPVQVSRSAGDDRVEERHPQRHGHDEHARHARGGVLLRPDDERIAAGEEQDADDREHAPVGGAPRQVVAQRERDRGEQAAGDHETQSREQEWGQHPHADPDGEVG